MAFVVSEAGERVSEHALIDHCRQKIASYKKPRSIRFVEALPRVSTGKVDKGALRAPFWADHDRAIV